MYLGLASTPCGHTRKKSCDQVIDMTTWGCFHWHEQLILFQKCRKTFKCKIHDQFLSYSKKIRCPLTSLASLCMPLSQLDDSLVGTGSEANNVAAVVAARRCNLLSHWIADQHNFCTPNHKRFHKTWEMLIYMYNLYLYLYLKIWMDAWMNPSGQDTIPFICIHKISYSLLKVALNLLLHFSSSFISTSSRNFFWVCFE